MAFTSINQIIEQSYHLNNPKIVAVPAANEEHALRACARAYKEGVIVPRLLGSEYEIRTMLEHLGLEEIVQFIVPVDGDNAVCASKAVEMAKCGEAQLLMKGSLQSSEYLRPIVSHGGLKKRETLSAMGITSVSAYHKVFIMTDGGLLLKPTLEQKKEEIINAVEVMRKMGHKGDIKVAVLCSSEVFNPKLPEMVDAAELKKMNQRGEITDCIVEGPISFDLATDMNAAKIKGYESLVAGDADILLVPDLACGNILGKSLTWAKPHGVSTIGGTTVPVALPSRGSSVEMKYEMLLFSALMAD